MAQPDLMRQIDRAVAIPVTLMLVVVLCVWLGIAGPLVTDIQADGIYKTLKDWQGLIGAVVAVMAAVIAWLNVKQQLRINLVSREEDRIERLLPGLRQTLDMLNSVLKELQKCQTNYAVKDLVDFVLRAEGNEPLDATMRRILPLADEDMLREVTGTISRLRTEALRWIALYDRREKAKLDVVTIAEFAPEEHEKVRVEMVAAEKELRQADEAVDAAIEALDQLRQSLDDRTRRAAHRLTRFRQQLEAYFEDTEK
jgi:prefoldin subunit 5